MARPEYWNYFNRYVLVPLSSDASNALKSEQAHFEASGTHAVGVVYIDHTAGISMMLETFCEFESNGNLRSTGGPRAKRSMSTLRYSIFNKFKFSPISP